MYTVHYNHKIIVFGTLTELYGKNAVCPANIQELKQLYEDHITGNNKELLLSAADISGLWADFVHLHKVIEAAGGLVRNNKGECLFIFRNGKWDLPKGKIDEGEGREAAAIREVEEECGISGLDISGPLTPTYHVYELKGERILKITYWYLMQSHYEGKLLPQLEEGITEVRWVASENINQLLINSYPSVIQVLKEAGA